MPPMIQVVQAYDRDHLRKESFLALMNGFVGSEGFREEYCSP